MDRKQLTPLERDERIAEARAVMNSPFMKELFADLQAEYIEKLIQTDVNSLTAATLHASIRVLADVQNRLKSYQNDGLFNKRR